MSYENVVDCPYCNKGVIRLDTKFPDGDYHYSVCNRCNGTGEATWITKDEKMIRVKDMNYIHIINAIKMLNRAGKRDNKMFDVLTDHLKRIQKRPYKKKDDTSFAGGAAIKYDSTRVMEYKKSMPKESAIIKKIKEFIL